MSSLTIRNLDAAIKTKLRLQAALHGCSMEAEARKILSQGVMTAPAQSGLAQRVNMRFRSLEVNSLPIPERQPARINSSMDE